MTKRSRTILFLTCVILFLITAPVLTLYSQGFRFDFKEKRLVQIGGISIQASPKQVEIYINGKLKGKTDFFFGTSLLENLLPQKYAVELKKTGYFPWKKNLPVQEGLVTEIRNVYLFPENPGFVSLNSTDTLKFFQESTTTATATDYIFSEYSFRQQNGNLYLYNPDTKVFEKFFEPLKGISVLNDNRKMAYFSDNELWVLFLQDFFSQPARKSGDKILLGRFSEKIGQVAWINEDYLVFTVGNKIKISEIDDRDGFNIYDLGEFESPEIFFNSADFKLYVLSEKTIYSSTKLLP